MTLLVAERLDKIFRTGEREISVLRGLEFSLGAGERVAILGESGVGKSTLLHVLGALDRPTRGAVRIGGEDVFAKTPAETARFRNAQLGFVFQFHHLLPEFSALENVMMPVLLGGARPAVARARAQHLLGAVALDARAAHPVGKLSGGERQRVAVARALAQSPPLLLADEPTGNLDPESGARVADLLLTLNRERGAALVVVTHNAALAARMERALVLENGRLRPA